MQTQPKPLVKLNELFSQQYCWTIEQLGFALDYSAISIRRFLKQLGYFSSFTHNSKWYTLSSIPEFDNNGLWFYNQIGFSRHGNLKQNIVYFWDKLFADPSCYPQILTLLPYSIASLRSKYSSVSLTRRQDCLRYCKFPLTLSSFFNIF